MSVSATPARRALALLVLAAGLLAGCAGPRTTVILMPDEDGHVGAVVVGGHGAAQRVDRAYDQTVVRARSTPSTPVARGEPDVARRYAELIKAQPTKPKTFVVNFLLDSTVMTDASRALVPDILEAARARKPTEIAVWGHADASGSEAHNDRLSLERARVVADLLRHADPSLENIEVRACGDRMPLVPSPARAIEPRNRRAEVVIL